MDLFDQIKDRLKAKKQTLVFPEGVDPRVLGACARLAKEEIVNVIVLGDAAAVEQNAKDIGVSLEGMQVIDPAHYEGTEKLAELFVERRKGKVTREEAETLLKTNVNYLGTMLVYAGEADGLVSGAMHATGDTVRPALQIIKMQDIRPFHHGKRRRKADHVRLRDHHRTRRKRPRGERHIERKDGKIFRYRTKDRNAQLLD